MIGDFAGTPHNGLCIPPTTENRAARTDISCATSTKESFSAVTHQNPGSTAPDTIIRVQ